MANKMIPTMQKVLGEIRDLVTYPAGRAEVIDLKIYKTKNLSDFEIWNWDNYYKSISLKGLEETNYFKENLSNSPTFIFDKFFFWDNYIKAGRTWLDKK